MKSRVIAFKSVYVVLLSMSAAVVVLSAFGDPRIFMVSAGLWGAAFVYMVIKLRQINKELSTFAEQLGGMISEVQNAALTEYPIPVMVARSSKEIVWYNDLCRDRVLGQEGQFGQYIDDIVPDVPLDLPCPEEGYSVVFRNRMFTVYVVRATRGKESMYVLYFIDDHDYKVCTNEYFESRLTMMLMVVDNYDELFQGAKENERGMVMGRIEEAIEKFVEDNNGLFTKLNKDRYLALIEERYMREIIAGRFPILDTIRAIEQDTRMSPTISIGVGRDAKTLAEIQAMANQSLDMALGRGGDQAAVKTKAGYEFYGGVSKAIEKRNKVRTRIVANALAEVVHNSDNVVIMGHRFGDLDSLGASIGMLKSVELLGKPAVIALRPEKSLAKTLYHTVMENGYAGKILTPEAALEIITKKTLLIVVDTHIESFLESQEIFQACQNVVVIDHHRKMVDHIDNAIIFYHEPYASSAAEMVAELTQYLGDGNRISHVEADALMAGIMLDTKNFTIRTGVRTFEAAAYLRRMGADTVKVRRLFASSMESYQIKSRLISSAEVYRRCAIAFSTISNTDMRVAAPQAADELLGISGVDASFVMYEMDEQVYISGRSMGAINVQIIMEKLGGGGHHTMAGAQLSGKTMDQARKGLMAAIDNYMEEQKKAME